MKYLKVFLFLIISIAVPVLAVNANLFVSLEVTLSDAAGPLEGYKRVKVELYSDDLKKSWREDHKDILFTNGMAILKLGEQLALHIRN